MEIIPEILKDKIRALAEKYRLSLVVLFGSQASGKTHKESDADIAVYAERRLGPHEIGEIAFVFSEKLGRKDVEILDLKSAPPLLLKKLR